MPSNVMFNAKISIAIVILNALKWRHWVARVGGACVITLSEWAEREYTAPLHLGYRRYFFDMLFAQMLSIKALNYTSLQQRIW